MVDLRKKSSGQRRRSAAYRRGFEDGLAFARKLSAKGSGPTAPPTGISREVYGVKIDFIADCLRTYAGALRSGEIDGAGHYFPADIDEAADLLETAAPALDEAFFADFIEWNLATFGPGLRTEGTIKHIRKELTEIEADPTDPKEWVDIGILGFNGLIRLGLTPTEVIAAFLGKHAVNKERKWPDWQDHPDTPIEHDRSAE